MRDLIAGERAPAAGATTFVLTGGAPPPLALVALGPDRRAAADFAPIDSITRELRGGVGFEDATRLRIDLAALPAGVDRLLLIAFDPANRPIDTRLTIASDTLRFAVDPGGQAAAVILIELYRHQGGWRIAANGQGFAVGLSAIAAAYGLERAWCDRLNPRLQDDTPDRGDRSGQSSGSGIAVEAHHILTNAHVVEDVRTISVHVGGRTLAAEMVFADPRNDLALLRVDTPLMQVAQFRSQVGLHLGEDVVALGFPLQGLLGTGPQASAGNIAALCGIGNDSSVFQFTAPIASGNSGGPILDMAGHLIGLVSSSLNLDRIRRSGASAENINFGIKGAMILSFLDSHGLEPQMAHDATPIGRTAVVARTRSAIARIACQC